MTGPLEVSVAAEQVLGRALEAYKLDALSSEIAHIVDAMKAKFNAEFTREKLPDGRIRVRLQMHETGDALGGLGATTEEAIAHLHLRTETLPDA